MSNIRSLIARFGADLSAFNKDIQNAAKALREGFGELDLSETNSALKGLNQNIKLSESEFRAATAGMDNWRENVDGLQARTKYLNDVLEDQRSILDGLNRKLELTEDKYGEGSTEANKLKIAINNQTAEIKKNEAELGKVTNELDNFGKETEEASGASTKLGDLFKAGFWSNIASNALSAVVSKIKEFASAAFETAGNINKLSDETGISAERLQELQYVVTAYDGSLELLAKSQAKLTKSMGEARDGTAQYQEAFEKLGLSVTGTNGELKNSSDFMYEVFDALGEITNETERDALALEIFGRSAQELNPLIKAGGDELRRLSDEAQESGAVMSSSTIRALDTLGDSLDLAKQKIVAMVGEGFARLIGAAPTVAEEVEELTASLEKNSNVMGLIDRYRELKEELAGTGLSAEETAEKTSELEQVKQQLISASNGVVTAIDLENGKFDEQVNVLAGLESANRDYIKYQLETVALENSGAAAAEKYAETLKEYESERESYISWMESAAEIQEKITNGDPATWGSSWESKLKDVQEMAEWYRDRLTALTETMRQLSEDTAAGEAAIKELVKNGFYTATEAAAYFGLSMEDVNRILGDLAIETQVATEKEKELVAEMEKISTTIDKVTEAYNTNYEAAKKSIDSQITFMSKMDTEAKKTAEELNNALMSQIKYLDNYDKNMDALLARNIEGIEDLAKNFTNGSADSAAALAGLAEASDAEIEEIIQNMNRVDLGKSQFATTIAQLQSDVDNTLDELQKRMDEAALEANLYDDMTEAGKNTVQGYIDGIQSKMADLQIAMSQMSAVGDLQTFNFPATTTGAQGYGVSNSNTYGDTNVNIYADDNMGAVLDLFNELNQRQRQGAR